MTMENLSFFTIILENIPRLSEDQLGTLQDVIEATLRGGKEAAYATDAELITLIKNGELLMAVKRRKEMSGDGLKESKDYVDALRRRLYDDGIISKY